MDRVLERQRRVRNAALIYRAMCAEPHHVSAITAMLCPWVAARGGDPSHVSVIVTPAASAAAGVTFSLGAVLGGIVEIRTLCATDRPLLERFGATLGERSRELFAPYPWDDAARLGSAFDAAVDHAVSGQDLTFFILRDGEPIGHFFLWGAGGNAHALAHGVDIPELGVAVADAFHGCGLGSLAVRILQVMAAGMGKDAIELTTAVTNEAGWSTYERAGFVFTGMIRNPLGVDVTTHAAGHVSAAQYREERQMVYIIRASRASSIARYLEEKRAQFAR